MAFASASGSGAVLPGPLTPADLQGTWRLIDIEAQPLRPSAETDLLAFTIADASIEGFDGCNEFWGRLDEPGPVNSTRRGCPEGAVKLPLDLSDPMSHLKSGRIEQGRLTLPRRGATPAAVFERRERDDPEAGPGRR